jgi:hypothetical protein
MRHFVAALVVAVAVPAAALAQATPSKTPSAARVVTDSARVGTYDLEIAMIDGTITGELTVKREASGLSATIAAGQNQPAVKSFARQGDEYLLIGGHGDFTVTYRLTFAKDSVSGSFKMSNGIEGRVVGALKR